MATYQKITEKKEEKRQALLSAAYTLFNEKRYEDVSIADITAHAKVAKGTFYLYFKDKTDIRDQLVVIKAREILKDVLDAIDIESKTNVEEVLMDFSSIIIDKLTESPFIVEILNKNLAWGVFLGGVNDIFKDSNIEYQELLMALFNRSDVKYKNPDHLLYFIIEFLGSTSYSSILYEEPAPIKVLKPEMLMAVHSMIKLAEL